MLQKKIKKYIVFALVVMFTFVIFVIPAGAESASADFEGGLSLESISICIIDAEYGEIYAEESIVPTEASTGLSNTVSFSIWVNGGPLSTATPYTLYIKFNAKDYIVSTANYCVGSFKVRMFDHVATFAPWSSFPKAFRDGNGPTQYAKCSNSVDALSGNNFATWTVDFSKNDPGTSYTDYACMLPFRVNSNVQAFRIFISDVNFQLINPYDAATDELTHGWDGPELDFDKDASDLGAVEEDALNENYKLLVGYDIDTGEPIYSEGTLQDMGKATITSVGDTVTSFLSAPQSLLAFTELFSRILYVPKLNLVVYLALALGILPLIYGLTINTSTSFIHRFTNRKE